MKIPHAWRYVALLCATCFAAPAFANLATTLDSREAWGKIPPPELRCPKDRESSDEAVAASIHTSVPRMALLKRLRALSNREICTLPTAKLQRALAKTEPHRPDYPAESARFRGLQQRDEKGEIRPDGLLRAVIQRSMVPRNSRSTMLRQKAAGISSTQWTALGPGNIGGRVRTLVIHPTNTSKIWAGSAGGGIWSSNNAGASWTPVNDFLPNLAISSIVIDPTNPNVMYAGTGDAYIAQLSKDLERGAGIFKSSDGGVTWAQLAATNPAANSDWNYVNRIAIHPTNANILLAALNNSAYRSADGGNTWTRVSQAKSLDVKFDPNDGNKAVRGRGDGMVSYSVDAGVSWALANVTSDTSARIEIAYAKSAPNLIYASVDVSNGAIYKSSDGGVNWVLMSTPMHLGDQGWYDNAIAVSPVDSERVVVGGIDLYTSANGGASFVKISTWYLSPTSPHADHHAIVMDPGFDGVTNRKVYVGNDGGIYRSSDINAANAKATGNSWTNLNNGFAITQFYSGAAHSNGKIIGGTQDNGSLRYVSGTNWSTFFGGDGGYSAVDSTDSNYIYGEYVYLAIHRSTNGGTSYGDYICNGLTDATNVNATCGSSSPKSNFIAPFMLDPNNANRMLAGGASLWLSSNVKASTPSWRIIKSAIGSASNTYISAIAVASGNSDIIWVGHNNGSVYRTSNGTSTTPTWILVSSGLPARFVTRIHIDKDNASKAYVTFGGYTSGNIRRTDNNGASWSDISGVLPQAPIRGFARHPSNANWLYAGTEVGVFTSEDGGTNWFTTNDGPGTVAVDDLFWLDSTTLVAATFGRGMFKTTVTNSSAVATIPQTGWWWNPAEGGRGFTIERQGNNIFVAGYMYAADGRATWYAAGPSPIVGTTFTSTLTEYKGGQTLTGTYKAPTSTSNVGNISIVFSDATHGTITWPGGVTPIQRFDIVSGGAAATIPAGTPEAGWWWNAAESGRGFSVEIQKDTMFLAGYMYDNVGNPIWYASGPTAMTTTTAYQGTWQQYGNGQTLTGAYTPPSVVSTNIVNVTIQFTSTTTGILTLPDGRQIPITRFTY